ncbi:MAG: HNH endonuclease [Ignavibacteria bacterium]|nr:HNH endonuclease [Ignavibacteria bacterium]
MTIPIYKKKQLIEIVSNSIEECGWNVLFLNNEDPYEIYVYSGDRNLKLRIIIYNITHGGKTRSEDEYRIQIKETTIDEKVNFVTLLLGYYDALEVYAGFDIEKHKNAAYSASTQIKKEALDNAYKNRFSIYNNSKDEIVVAFRPEFFMEYVLNRRQLHEFGDYASDMKILNSIIEENRDVNQAVLDEISENRKKVVINVTKRVRDSSFKERILVAYSHKCAICGLQLKLIDAAHVLPVGVDDSNDETSNGIALCALHHRAYDRALVTFDEKYDVLHNTKKIEEIKTIGHDGGLDKFLKNLNEKIALPPSVSDRPHVEFIKKANNYRGWN